MSARGGGDAGPEAGRDEPHEIHGLRGDVVLDTIGLYCPIPIIRTAERIRSLTTGQVLEVLSDDRVILIDMPAWCRSTGHTWLGYSSDETGWRLYVRVK